VNPAWLALIIPGYAFMAGFAGTACHNSKAHDQERCNDGRDGPSCIAAGLFWPLLIPLLIIIGSVLAGMRAEKLRPVRRRERQKALEEALKKEIAAMERENGLAP